MEGGRQREEGKPWKKTTAARTAGQNSQAIDETTQTQDEGGVSTAARGTGGSPGIGEKEKPEIRGTSTTEGREPHTGDQSTRKKPNKEHETGSKEQTHNNSNVRRNAHRIKEDHRPERQLREFSKAPTDPPNNTGQGGSTDARTDPLIYSFHEGPTPTVPAHREADGQRTPGSRAATYSIQQPRTVGTEGTDAARNRRTAIIGTSAPRRPPKEPPTKRLGSTRHLHSTASARHLHITLQPHASGREKRAQGWAKKSRHTSPQYGTQPEHNVPGGRQQLPRHRKRPAPKPRQDRPTPQARQTNARVKLEAPEPHPHTHRELRSPRTQTLNPRHPETMPGTTAGDGEAHPYGPHAGATRNKHPSATEENRSKRAPTAPVPAPRPERGHNRGRRKRAER
uniref:Uncharacterized protein n=1 Tax=Knipowitschia caucasica TaxID=637954 RepID=A0AAV2MNM8_KNICA